MKPSSMNGNGLSKMIEQLKTKILMAADVDVSNWRKQPECEKRKSPSNILGGKTDKVIAIGASTGGTVALRKMISEFPTDMPGTVVVQHMPPVFTKLFAERLNDTAKVEVKEAASGDRLTKGRVLIAPGKHVGIRRARVRFWAVADRIVTAPSTLSSKWVDTAFKPV